VRYELNVYVQFSSSVVSKCLLLSRDSHPWLRLVKQFTNKQVVICFCPVDKAELEYDDCGTQRNEWYIQNVSSGALF
jgi:hypothetical protein